MPNDGWHHYSVIACLIDAHFTRKQCICNRTYFWKNIPSSSCLDPNTFLLVFRIRLTFVISLMAFIPTAFPFLLLNSVNIRRAGSAFRWNFIWPTSVGSTTHNSYEREPRCRYIYILPQYLLSVPLCIPFNIYLPMPNRPSLWVDPHHSNFRIQDNIQSPKNKGKNANWVLYICDWLSFEW
jgi:hypothetical protein